MVQYLQFRILELPLILRWPQWHLLLRIAALLLRLQGLAPQICGLSTPASGFLRAGDVEGGSQGRGIVAMGLIWFNSTLNRK